jgi:hypothetical integral membrane protein (TIGR02206 family)
MVDELLSISDAGEFELFGFVHWVTIAVIGLMAAVLVFLARTHRLKRWVEPMSGSLAVLLLGNEAIWLVLVVYLGLWDMQWGLPLQICDLAIFLTAYSLLHHRQWAWELAYFWGLAGTLQAIATPDIHFNFPHYYFFKFFITHGGIVTAVVFLAAGCGRRITRASIGRVWLITNLYALLIGIFNGIFKTNYLYLCHKPLRASLLDYLGPWPCYIIGLEVILFVSLWIYYLPFFIAEKMTKSAVI